MKIASPTSWLRLAGFVVAGAMLATAAARQAATGTLAYSMPSLVNSIAPGNAAILSSAYNNVVTEKGDTLKPSPYWLARARAALRDNPLTAQALRIYAFNLPDQSIPHLRPVMTLGEQVSRRDTLTQIWLIEDAVGNGRIEQALRHYDRALSSSDESRQMLMPVLSEALGTPQVRNALVPYLQRRPWNGVFLTYAASHSSALDGVIETIEKANGAGQLSAVYQPAATIAMGRLVDQGQLPQAQRLASRIGGMTPAAIRNVGFSQESWMENLHPLTWTPINDADIVTALDSQNTVNISTSSSTAKVALYRVTPARSGSYDFSQSVSFPDDAHPARGTWQVLCVNGKETTQLLAVEVAPGTNERSRSRIAIPANCSALRLSFMLAPTDGATDAAIRLNSVSLSPLPSDSRVR
ncbi:hypothetical protein RN629_17080 [Sphingomonadaceae bacterium jetA1]|jgi:hypothetical protein|uniref:hypothetical protein n=1 Tax=Facivitalis istanbulensis TaxID=3075838 RepID=UPI0034734A85